MSPQSAPADAQTKTARPFLRWTIILLAVVAILILAWTRWVYGQIQWYATRDMAAPSDAIAVFGAAEYDGHPSPVFRARLDHAETLYGRGIAPLIITLGGDGGDQYSEGRVGEQYLVGAGVPDSDIIAETESTSTDQSVHRLAVIARTNSLQRIVVVSDATHLFRIHQICAANGLNVLTSPRPRVPVEGPSGERERIQHEIISYTLWRLHLD